jgi:hypothetical protein
MNGQDGVFFSFFFVLIPHVTGIWNLVLESGIWFSVWFLIKKLNSGFSSCSDSENRTTQVLGNLGCNQWLTSSEHLGVLAQDLVLMPTP